MRFFGLRPEDVIARTPSGGLQPRSLAFSIAYGALSFGAISILAYSPWAFLRIGGTAALYASVAAIYVGLTGLALSRLVLGARTGPRFAGLLAVAFVAYALVWCAFWFGLKGRHHADLWGSAVGLAAMTFLIQRAFGQNHDFLPTFAVLFALHTLGYYLGESLHVIVGGPAGKLLWGAAHGLGFGGGLGYVLFASQQPLKLQLAARG
jgi:hypothetical protein